MKRRIFRANVPLAIEPSALGAEYDALPMNERTQAVQQVAIVRVRGPLTQHQETLTVVSGLPFPLPPPDSYEAIVSRALQAFADEQVCGVVLAVTSPGGHAAGCFEAAGRMRELADATGKPFLAYIEGQACSAAYALAISADRVFAEPSSIVGSIGTLKEFHDHTEANAKAGCKVEIIASGKRKADGNPNTTMSDEARAAEQEIVDDLAAVFFEHVAARRGLSVDAIRALEAGQLVGARAKAAGLVDEIATLDQVVAACASGEVTTASAEKETEDMSKMDETMKALRAIAEGDDKDEAAKARAALKAMGGDDDKGDEGKAKSESEGDDKGDDDEGKAKSEAEGDDEGKAKSESDDESRAQAASSSSASASASTVTLEALAADMAEFKKSRLAEQRTAILATRPDLSKEQIGDLKSVPTAALASALKAIPRGTPPVTAAAAAATAQGTRGATQAEGRVSHLPPEEKARLDAQMGLARTKTGVVATATSLKLGAVVPDAPAT